MVALSVAPVGLRRDGHLSRIDRFDGDVGLIQERQCGIEERVVPTRDGGELDGCAGGNHDAAGITDRIPEFPSLFLGQKERQYRRGVEGDHRGRPRSSYSDCCSSADNG